MTGETYVTAVAPWKVRPGDTVSRPPFYGWETRPTRATVAAVERMRGAVTGETCWRITVEGPDGPESWGLFYRGERVTVRRTIGREDGR